MYKLLNGHFIFNFHIQVPRGHRGPDKRWLLFELDNIELSLKVGLGVSER